MVNAFYIVNYSYRKSVIKFETIDEKKQIAEVTTQYPTKYYNHVSLFQ